MSMKSMPKSLWKSCICWLLVVVMALSCSVFVFAEEEETQGEPVVPEQEEGLTAEQQQAYEEALKESQNSQEASDEYITGFVRDNLYEQYYEKYSNFDVQLPEIVIDAPSFVSATAKAEVKDSFEGKNGVLYVTSTGDIVYNIQVSTEGMYEVEFAYYPLVDTKGNDLEFEILVDGVAPYDEASRLTMPRIWVNDLGEDGVIGKDSVGNELLPTQIQKPKWVIRSFADSEGRYLDKLKFYLTPGAHTITLVAVSGEFAMDQLRLFNNGDLTTYDTYYNNLSAQGVSDAVTEFRVIEAENFADKTASLIQMQFDRSDAKVTPYSVSKTVYNTLGGTNWAKSGQSVDWEIDVPADGFYEISYRFRQSYMRGMTTYRRVMIDGVVPFAEAEYLPFPYKTGFQYATAGRDTENGEFEAYKFYLTAGKHTLTFEANIGLMSETYRAVEDIVYQLNYIYRKIVLVTGTEPDTNRDYKLFEKIPDLQSMMEEVHGRLVNEKTSIDTIYKTKGGSAEILTTLAVQMEDFIEKPYSIPQRISNFKDNISTMGSWMLDIKSQPVRFDKILVAGTAADVPSQVSSAFESISHEVRAFISSFVDDYTSVGGVTEDGRTISVWVGTARDQALALKTLTDNYFTPDTNIGVNISLVPLGVLSRAIIAGKGPNVALHVSRTEPMNLGIRGALVNVQDMPGYEEILGRYSKYALAPYQFNSTMADGTNYSKTFGVPETQNFDMMFYRTDIFAELGIEPPTTWDEFDEILPVIQSNNMTVGLNQATGGGLFFTFIQQRNGLIYKEDGSMTNFTEQYAVDAFTKWTDYYRMYDFPLTYSFYTRFRNGEMPLAFASYSNATYIAESAPELRGLWAMAPIPGTVGKDGKVNYTEESSGLTASIIIKSTAATEELRKQEEADSWEFVKWWTSAETAADYGKRVEMAIGSVARYTTANLEAFDMIGWSAEESAAIKKQRESIKELPELVGGYYVARMVTNAFRSVTNDNKNQREQLFYYNEQINHEIWRKRAEYGFSVPEEANK